MDSDIEDVTDEFEKEPDIIDLTQDEEEELNRLRNVVDIDAEEDET